MAVYTQGAFVIVLNENQQILLVKRKNVPLWDLPGGRIDLGNRLRQRQYVKYWKRQDTIQRFLRK